MPDDELDEAALQFFDLVQIAARPWPEQEQITGGTISGIAWELRNDIRADGKRFLAVFGDRLSASDVNAVSAYIEDFDRLPEAVFAAPGNGDGIGLRHSAWEDVRRESISLLRLFEPRIRVIYGRFDLDTHWLDQLLRS